MRLKETKIELQGLRLFGNHGITDAEQAVGSNFELNISLFFGGNLESFGKDSLEQTVDYAEACKLVKETFQQTSKTLENVAARIAKELLSHFQLLTKVQVEIKKLNPPLQIECDAAAVILIVER